MPDLVDILHVLTSLHIFADLAEGRGADAARKLIWRMAEDALDRGGR
jgi:hypothetical protein